MGTEAQDKGFAVLFFPCRGGDTSVIYVSTPAPSWLGEEDLSKIVIEEIGIYCLFFLIPARTGTALLSVNGHPVPGSLTKAYAGSLCGSAVCSIRERALPCCLEVCTEDTTEGGIFVVARVDV